MAINQSETISKDAETRISIFNPVGFDGVNFQRGVAECMATKVTVSGNYTYVAVSAPGTAQSSALWQVQKVDTTTGTVITWADGNANFDNVATDLTALTYS